MSPVDVKDFLDSAFADFEWEDRMCPNVPESDLAISLVDYRTALSKSLTLIDAMRTAEPGSFVAASLADKLAQQVQALTLNAQFLLGQREKGVKLPSSPPGAL